MTAKAEQPAPSRFSSVQSLTRHHDVSAFDSGQPSLDEWLKKYALQAQATDSTKSYVVTAGDRVVGYYSLAAGTIRVADATARAGKAQPKAGSVPVALLARLAIDQSVQRQGLGSALLKDALLRCEQAADIIGVRAVLVHALDERAKAFYLRYDFEASPVDEMTLMLLMTDVRAAMGL